LTREIIYNILNKKERSGDKCAIAKERQLWLYDGSVYGSSSGHVFPDRQ
jgi:hypothetical protein